MWNSERGQSETIGNVLLIGVVVVVATTAAVGITFNLTGGGGVGGLGGEAQQADIQASATADNLTLGHNGGERLPGGDVLVVVSNGSAERRFAVDAANLTGTGDSFDPGETFTRAHGLTGDSIDVQVTVGDQRQSRLLLDTTVGLPTVVPVTNSVSWSQSDSFSETTRSNSRYILTGGTSFGQPVGPDGLTLQNVNATEPQGTSITIVVQSDPDDDGVYEDTGDPIKYNQSKKNYSVSRLSAESQHFRLRIELTPATSSSVSFNSATLTTGSSQITWASASDWDGGTSQKRTVHDAVGDRSADTLSLGYQSRDANGTNLTAYWALDDGDAGQATDASGNGYSGQNNDISSAEGVLGTSAYDFGGTGWSELNTFPDFQRNFSVAGWIRTTNPGSQGQRVFADDESNTGGYAVSVGDGGAGAIRFYSRDVSPISMDSPSVVQASTWHHVTATVNTRTNTRTIYLNGSQIRQGTYSGSWGTDSGPASIGGETDQGESGNRFAGRIDELRIYNRTLTDADAQRLYATSHNGTFITGTKSFDSPVSPSDLTLSNLTVNRPTGTAVNVTVLSDPDGDGTFDKRSSTIQLDGSDSYDVSGLSADSSRYRIEIELSTGDITTTPAVSGFSLSV
jgi:hypothetical protein